MPPKLVIPPEVDELVLRFGELEIGINVRRASSPTGASSTWELVSAADSSTGTGASLAALPHVSSNLVAQSLAASSAADFAALPLGFLDHLVNKLRGTDSAWVPQARVGRAFKAGVVASLRLEGQCSEVKVPSIPYRISVYIILRAPGLDQGGWTPNYSTYLRAVGAGAPAGQDFHDSSVSHSFATRAEGEAFLAGAGKAWPPLLR